MKRVPKSSKITCPGCGKPMVQREGRYGKFYGCTGFPTCRETRPFKTSNAKVIEKKPLVRIDPNRYQQAIIEWALNGGGNLVVSAKAGTGKTVTLQNVAGFYLPKHLRMQYLCYNATVRDEALEVMPEWVPVKSTHQFGLGIVRDHTGRSPKIDDKKCFHILKFQVCQYTWDEDWEFSSPVLKIVGLLKNTLRTPTDENIEAVISYYGIRIVQDEHLFDRGGFDTYNGDDYDYLKALRKVCRLVRDVMRISDNTMGKVDFDDMLYMPWRHRMHIPTFDWILGDEVQDWNAAQLHLVTQAIKSPTSRGLFVGDENQSMYGFRGADVNAMDNVRSATKAERVPLSITYRCPLSHVELVNEKFPQIEFEAAPDAKVGTIDTVDDRDLTTMAVPNDMILCRTNAPLVKPILALIKQGRKANIRGRNFGEELDTMVQKFDAKSLSDLLSQLGEFAYVQIARLERAEKTQQAMVLADKVETITALSETCDTVKGLSSRITTIFDDSKAEIMGSTVHKAKGLQAPNVFIIEPGQMPHPMAKKAWEMQQEQNIKYVAFTRSKGGLYFVGQGPDMGEQSWIV